MHEILNKLDTDLTNGLDYAVRSLELLSNGADPEPDALLSGLVALEMLQSITLTRSEAGVVADAQKLLHLASIGHLDTQAPDRTHATALAEQLATIRNI